MTNVNRKNLRMIAPIGSGENSLANGSLSLGRQVAVSSIAKSFFKLYILLSHRLKSAQIVRTVAPFAMCLSSRSL